MSSQLEKQLQVLREGFVDLISEKEFEERFREAAKKKRPLRVKYGADPSTPDLHLGHTVPLRKLKQFQDFGHQVVFIIGDFTARIGDPSGRSETRRMLSPKEVKENAETYQNQAFRILDRRKTEVQYNSKWLDKMKPADFLNLMSQYTVARLIERDDFSKRFQANQPIALIEFLYPLLQGYDSVEVKSDIEIGGTDQKFNLLVGRELQRVWNQLPQVVATLPLIEGMDGVQKMSKTAQNDIAVQDIPKEMFGKVMSLPDSLLERYYLYVSALPLDEIHKVITDLKSGKLHPREAKARLAEQIVSVYHNAEKARQAREEFDRVFKHKGLPDFIETIVIPEKAKNIVLLLVSTKLVSSKGEARRLIQQGGVKVEQEKVEDEKLQVDLQKPVLIQCGKRKFARVRYHA